MKESFTHVGKPHDKGEQHIACIDIGMWLPYLPNGGVYKGQCFLLGFCYRTTVACIVLVVSQLGEGGNRGGLQIKKFLIM